MRHPRGWKGLQNPPAEFDEVNKSRSAGRPTEGWFRARINLPPLSTLEAVLLLEVLDRMSRSVWKANGDGIAEYMAAVENAKRHGSSRPKRSLPPQGGDPPLDDF